MPFRVGLPELIIILVIVLVVFGVGKLSEAGGALGRGLREFRKELKKESNEDEEKKGSETRT